jgi:parallel beta-helix repeat protein
MENIMTRNSLQRWWRRIFNGSHVQLAPRRGRVRLRLETFEERNLPTVFLVTTTAETGTGSLSAAILASNSTPGSNVIDFDIVAGPQTIDLTQPLPTIENNPVTIDGSSQPGWVGNALINLTSAGLDESIVVNTPDCKIEDLLFGFEVFGGAIALYSSNNVVSGNMFETNLGVTILEGASGNVIGGTTLEAGNVFSCSTGIAITEGSTGNVVEGNTISGGSFGIDIESGSNKNTVGGTAPGTGNTFSFNGVSIINDGSVSGTVIEGNSITSDSTSAIEIGGPSTTVSGNVISGSTQDGILIQSTGSNALVHGNLIGTDPTGATAQPNSGNGIEIQAPECTIGGTTAAAGNLISGNTEDGILIDSGATGTLVEGNKIGTNQSGSSAVPNSGVGIEVEVSDCTIGGTTSGSGNIIAFNTLGGLEVTEASSAAIHGNSIFSEAGKGIELVSNGNSDQAAPVLSQASFTPAGKGGLLAVGGTLASTANKSFTLDFFANPAGDPEGKIFLGNLTVTTSTAGTASFTAKLNVPAGFSSSATPLITATATNSVGETSQFSSGVTDPIIGVRPSWTAATNVLLPPMLPGSYSTSTNSALNASTIGSVFGSFFRYRITSVPVGIAIMGITGNGTWQYSLDNGASWVNLTGPSKSTALLLSASDLIRFVPKTTAAGTATLTAYGWDGGFGATGTRVNMAALSAASGSAFSLGTKVAVCHVNTAPTLANPDITVAGVNENVTSQSITAATLLSLAGYSDVDGKSVPSGIAITGDSGSGVWQWLDGSTWVNLPVVSGASVLLLPAEAKLRFKPSDNLPAGTDGLATLSFLAWDMTEGTAGKLYPLSSQGGVTAFSDTSTTASMAVDFA